MEDNNKSVVITGAASGMGRAAAERLSKAGWQVLAVDLNADQLAWTEGTGIASLVADVSSEADNDRIATEANKLFGGLNAAIFNAGIVGGPFEGATLLLLTSTGAKSGQPRLNPLAYFGLDGRIIIVGSKAGADTNPAWVHNLRAHPRAHIEVGTEAYDVTARELPDDERAAVFDRIVAASPGFGDYQAKTSRVIPLFELVQI